jgi:hypothetical protein
MASEHGSAHRHGVGAALRGSGCCCCARRRVSSSSVVIDRCAGVRS